MRFLTVLQNFTVINTHSAQRALYSHDTAEDGFIYINFANQNDESDELQFLCSAEVTINPNDPSSFTVEDTDGDAIRFNAYNAADLTVGG